MMQVCQLCCEDSLAWDMTVPEENICDQCGNYTDCIEYQNGGEGGSE